MCSLVQIAWYGIWIKELRETVEHSQLIFFGLRSLLPVLSIDLCSLNHLLLFLFLSSLASTVTTENSGR